MESSLQDSVLGKEVSRPLVQHALQAAVLEDLSWEKRMAGSLLGCLQERSFIDAGCRAGDIMAAGIAGHAEIH